MSDALDPDVLEASNELAEIRSGGMTESALERFLGLPPGELRTKLKNEKRDPRKIVMAKVALRRAVVARLFLGRRKKAEIAEILGVNRATITRDVQAIEKEWAKERLSGVADFIRRELRELDEMEREAISCFYGAETEAAALRWFQMRLTLKEKRWKLLGLTSGVELEVLIREELSLEVDSGATVTNLEEIDDAATLVALYRRQSGATG